MHRGISRKINALLMFVLMLFTVPFPVFGQEDVTAGTEVTFTSDAGMTPDSPFYFMDQIFDTFQDPESVAQEKLGEMELMIDAGDYEHAGDAADAYHGVTDNIISTVEQGDTVENYLADTNFVLDQEEVVSRLKEELTTAVEDGSISGDDAGATGIDDLQGDVLDVHDTLGSERDEQITSLEEDQGITSIEAEITLQAEEDNIGIGSAEETITTEAIPALEEVAGVVQDNLDSALEDNVDTLPEEDIIALNKVGNEIGVGLQIAIDELDAGREERAYEALLDAQEHLLIVDQFLSDQETGQPFLENSENRDALDNDVKEIDDDYTQRGEEAKKYLEEYDANKDQLLEQYPEMQDDFEQLNDRFEKVDELARLKEEQYSTLYDQLIADGKTPLEAADMLEGQFADEYEKAYGEPFLPPGLERTDVVLPGRVIDSYEIPMGRISTEEFQGGFLEGYEYTDPFTGYIYEMTKDGYTYTSPLGVAYEVKFDKGFSDQAEGKGFYKGNEEYSYTAFDQNGEEVTYTYTPTGYTVTQPDGTEETFAYDIGGYKVMGGGELDIKATGFDVIPPTRDERVRWEYSPIYDNFISTHGDVYTPNSEGMAIQSQYMTYDSDAGIYSYKMDFKDRVEEADWSFDPTAGVWVAGDGEVYAPVVNTVAPVGHEGSGSYTTQSGDSWVYDNGEWMSAAGETWRYDEGKHTFESGEGQVYNPELTYEVYYGFDYSTDEERSFEAGGETWSYDADKGIWSNGEDTYAPAYSYASTGETSQGESGHNYYAPAYYSPTFSYTPTFSGDEAGGETSTGEDHVWNGYFGDMGGGYVPPSYSPTGDYSSSGSYGYYTPTNDQSGEFKSNFGSDSTGGTYTAPSSGGSGSYSAPSGGSYSAPSGGDSGSYSAPSGGDSGSYSAPSGGDSGGFSGGTMSITGYTIVDFTKYRVFRSR